MPRKREAEKTLVFMSMFQQMPCMQPNLDLTDFADRFAMVHI